MEQGWKPELTAERLAETESEIAAVTKIRDSLAFDFVEDKGSLYRVDLAPQDDEYLLWDKPFDEQSPKVKAALTESWKQLTERRGAQGQEVREHDRPWSIKKDSKGENIYRSVTATAPGGREAEGSKALLEMGVRGIKYQDQQSRGKDGGSYNYVIFDDSDVAIEEIMLQREQLGMFDTEQTDQGEQAVIPGAEKASDRELAERGMKGRMKPKAAQKMADEGLFDTGAGKQLDLEDALQSVSLDNALFQQAQGTPAEEAAIAATIGNSDRPPLQKLRQWVKNTTAKRGLLLRQGMIDSFASIESLERQQNDGDLLSAEMSAIKAAHMTKNLQSVMGVVLKHGMIDLKTDAQGGLEWFDVDRAWKGGGFEDIFKGIAEKGQLQLWQGWAYANRAQRLIQEGKESNMSQEQIDTLLPLGEKNPEFRVAMDKWTAFNDKLLDIAEKAGLINAEQRAIWQKDDYVPFYRLDEEALEGGADGQGGGKGPGGIAGQRSGIRTLTGSDMKANDIIENMVMNMASLVDRSFKNVAARKVWSLMLDAGAIKAAPQGWNQVRVSPEQAAAKLREIGVDVSTLSPAEAEQALNFYQMKDPPDPKAVSVMVDGKPVWGIVEDPLLYNAITSMEPTGLGNLAKTLGFAKRALTVGVTTDLGFMLANAVRDTLSAWVATGQKGFIPVVDTAKGFVKALNNDPSLVSIMASGAGSGGFYRTEAPDVRKQMNAKLRGIDKNTILDSPKKLWEAWTRVGAASESATRIGLFEAAQKEGVTDAEAAYRALDVLDFSRTGGFNTMRWLIQVVPFMNARIQGLDKVYRGAKDNPKAFVLRGSMIMGASLALLAHNWDDERYEELEEWDKDTYFHFWADGQHYRLPKPFEIGALFSTVPERLFRGLLGKDETRESAKATARMFTDTFAMNPIPHAFMPAIEQLTNHNLFTGRPIVGPALDRLLPEEQATARTGDLARTIGKATKLSPVRIEHAVRGYLGTMGLYAMQLGDVATRAVTDGPPRPEMRLDEIPVVSRFMRDDPPKTTRYVTEFYRMKRETDRAYNTLRHLATDRRTENAKALLRSKAGKIALYPAFQKAGTAMSGLRKVENQIRVSPEMSPGEKRRLLDKITQKRNELAKRMVQAAPAMSRLVSQAAKLPAEEQHKLTQ